MSRPIKGAIQRSVCVCVGGWGWNIRALWLEGEVKGHKCVSVCEDIITGTDYIQSASRGQHKDKDCTSFLVTLLPECCLCTGVLTMSLRQTIQTVPQITV